jgi:hypothetical protein
MSRFITVIETDKYKIGQDGLELWIDNMQREERNEDLEKKLCNIDGVGFIHVQDYKIFIDTAPMFDTREVIKKIKVLLDKELLTEKTIKNI